jgi:hypothetical protein
MPVEMIACPKCGEQNSIRKDVCYSCGTALGPAPGSFPQSGPMQPGQRPVVRNTSGQGPGAIVPAEIQGWNWGAFFMGWIWGIAHSTWIAFLAFIPIVGVVMPFVLGAKGNEWGWQNRRFEGGVEEFKQTQRVWAIVGLVICAVSILSYVFIFSAMIAGLSHQPDPEEIRKILESQPR